MDGIDVNVGNPSPIWYSAMQGHTKIVHALLNVDGIDLNTPCGSPKMPPICVAAARGHDEVVQALCSQKAIKKGIDVDAMGEHGANALLDCLTNQGGAKAEKIVKLLLDTDSIDVNR